MNQKQIKLALKNTQLDAHTRETLLQTLHYMQAEGVDTTTMHKGITHNGSRKTNTRSTQTHKRTKSTTRHKQ